MVVSPSQDSWLRCMDSAISLMPSFMRHSATFYHKTKLTLGSPPWRGILSSPPENGLGVCKAETESLKFLYIRVCDGGSRIRTHGRLSPPAVFKTAAIVHSAIPPRIHEPVGNGVKTHFPICTLPPRPLWRQRSAYFFALPPQWRRWVWNRSPPINHFAAIQF